MQSTQMTHHDYLAFLKRRKWIFLIPALGILILSLVVAFILPSMYRSEATIFIEQQELPSDFVTTTVTSYVEQRLQTINQRIMSFSPLLKIINGYNLYPEMKGKYSADEIVEKMRSHMMLEPMSAEIVDRRTGRPTTATIAFKLSYEGRNPQKVQRVTNVIASLFLEENLKERVQQVEDTSTFLEAEVSRMKVALSSLDNKIALFKQKNMNELPEMIQVNMHNVGNIERNIGTANQQLRSLKEREGYLLSQLASISPFLEKEGRGRLEELKLQLLALSKQYSEEYPDVKKVRAEIIELEKSLSHGNSRQKGLPDNPAYINFSAQLAGVQADIKSINKQIANLTADAAGFKKSVAAAPAIEDEYKGMIMARQSTQEKYNDLMGKLMDARVAHGMEKEQKGERFTLVDAPRVPENPYKPNRMAIVLIGVVLGIGAGFGAVSIAIITDDRVYSAAALKRATNLPILAGVPVILNKKDVGLRRKKRIAIIGSSILLVIVGLAVAQHSATDVAIIWQKLMR